MGRPSNAEERRAQIVDALLTVMAERGYEGATMAAIAERAGLTRGLLHYHFASKQEMLVALVARLAEGLAARESRRVARVRDDARARLFAFVDAHVAEGDDADARAVAAWVVIAVEAVRQPEVRVVYERAVRATFERLVALTADALRAEASAARNASRLASLVLSAIEGAYLLSAASPGVLPAGYAAPMLRRTLAALLDEEAKKP